jgi:hypothetical protein
MVTNAFIIFSLQLGWGRASYSQKVAGHFFACDVMRLDI